MTVRRGCGQHSTFTPPPPGCLSDYSGSHGLPDTITQRGTITGEWKIPLILREEEDSGIAVLTG